MSRLKEEVTVQTKRGPWTYSPNGADPRTSTWPFKVKEPRLKVRLVFAWYDFWVGLFWDRRKRMLYVFPVPCFGLVVEGL